MSDGRIPGHEDTAKLFLRHLTGTADEAESQELERAVLEDDAFFQRLRDLESEMVDAYVDGELDEETTRRLAPVVGASPRLQARAETTLALETRQGGGGGLARASVPVSGVGKRWPRMRLALLGLLAVALALVAWLFVHVAGLRASVRALEAENAVLQERLDGLEEKVSRFEASNRNLTRRLARLEAERGH